MKFKKLIASTIRHLFLLSTYVYPWFSKSNRKVRIIMYHGVGDDRFTAEAFENQMKYIKRHFVTHWASELPNLLDSVETSNTKYGKPDIILTFDDGLKNNVSCAAPIIEKLGLKATFYIVSDLLDGHSMLWNHEIRCRLELMGQAHAMEFMNIKSFDAENSVNNYLEQLKTYSGAKRQDILYSLREKNIAPDYTQKMLTRYQIMSQHDVINLPDCIEIGSHTRTHPILDTIEDKSFLEDEIAGSKKILENLLNRPVTTFCYPNGNFTADVESIVAKHYTVGVTVNEGFVENKKALFRLKRIPAADDLKIMSYRLLRPES